MHNPYTRERRLAVRIGGVSWLLSFLILSTHPTEGTGVPTPVYWGFPVFFLATISVPSAIIMGLLELAWKPKPKPGLGLSPDRQSQP